MPIIATEPERREVELIPAGLHPAVCYAVIDTGTHHDDRYDKWKQEIVLMWEIPGQRISVERDGRTLNLPRAISKRYTLSLGEKALLRKDLAAWRGRDFTPEELKAFDLRNVLGKTCLLQIMHDPGKGKNASKTFANVNAVMPKMATDQDLVPENPKVYFSIEDHGAGMPPPAGIPEWIRKIIMDSKEYREACEVTIDDGPNEEVQGEPEAEGEGEPF